MTDPNVSRNDTVGSTSLSLLARVQTCDQAAWERLVHLYSPLVYRWCCRAGLQAADAADVGQEVFRAVARKIADFRHDAPGDTFRGWLRTITRNKVADLARGRRDRHGCGGDVNGLAQLPAEEPPSTVDGPADEEVRLVLQRALELVRAEFEERTWQAFWRVAVDDQRVEDVAAALGMTPNAVYLAKSRIRRRLREEFVGLVELG